jgi:hypothetical protein
MISTKISWGMRQEEQKNTLDCPTPHLLKAYMTVNRQWLWKQLDGIGFEPDFFEVFPYVLAVRNETLCCDGIWAKDHFDKVHTASDSRSCDGVIQVIDLEVFRDSLSRVCMPRISEPPKRSRTRIG